MIESAGNTQQNAIGWFLPNLILPAFPVGMLISWLFPLNVEHGYAANYDMIILLVFIIIYSVYLLLYGAGKVKGTFVLVKRD